MPERDAAYSHDYDGRRDALAPESGTASERPTDVAGAGADRAAGRSGDPVRVATAASFPESDAERDQRRKERADKARPNVSMTPGQAQTLSAATTPRLVRAGKGYATIHKPTCRYAANGLGWSWADRNSDDEWLDKAWLHPCKVCLPDLAAQRENLTLISEEDYLYA